MRWCMSDHIEGDTELLSSKHIFGNKIIQNKKDLLHPVLLWVRDLQKQIPGRKK